MPTTAARQMEAAYCDPDTGSIKRRWLKRRLAGIIAIGPTVLNPPTPQPTRTDAVIDAKHDVEVRRKHRETVEAELVAIGRHAADIDRRVELLGSTSAASSFATQELVAEARQLRELRSMFEADIAAGPITRDRDGRPIDETTRAYVRVRAKELAEQYWSAATRADAEGDRRRGRQLRRDALRSRLLAEAELNLRPEQPGYGIVAWN